MSSIESNNPAARVYLLLRKAKDSGGAKTVADGLASVFGVRPNDHGELFRNLGLLNSNLDTIVERLRQTENEHFLEIYQESLPRLKNVLAFQNFAISWDQFRQVYLHEEDLRTLKFCAAALAKNGPERVLSEDELKNISEKVNTLWEEVLGSDLQRELKRTILDCLDKIRQAIRDYKILGAEGIDSAVHNAVVLAILTEKAETNDPSTMENFRTFVRDTSALVTLGKLLYPLLHNLPQLMHDVPKALGM